MHVTFFCSALIADVTAGRVTRKAAAATEAEDDNSEAGW